MVLREGKVDITGIPPVPPEYGIDGSSTLDETLGPNNVGGLIKK
jgi:hypothetical protein